MQSDDFFVGEQNFPISIFTDFDLSGGLITPSVLVSRPTLAVSAAIADDGGTFTNHITKVTEKVSKDIPLLPKDAVAISDAFYVGTTTRISAILFGQGQLGIGSWAVAWEFWNGAVWGAVSNLVDGTNAFKAGDDIDGVLVSFSIPTTSVRVLVDGKGPFHFIRARVITADVSPTTQPLASWIRIGKDVIPGSIVGTGTTGFFTVVIPEGLLDEAGRYRLQAKIVNASEVQKGTVAELLVKREFEL